MKRVPVLVLGAGGVGQALLQQIVNGRTRQAERVDCHFDVLAVADSRSCLLSFSGLSDTDLLTILREKRAKRPLHPDAGSRPTDLDLVDTLAAGGVEQALVVDVTAADGMEPAVISKMATAFSLARQPSHLLSPQRSSRMIQWRFNCK